MTFLDTNFLVFALSRGTAEDQKLRGLLLANEAVGVSSIAWTEFLCGPVTPEHVKLASVLFPAPEPFQAEDGVRAAELFNGTGRRRGSLADCMIAAISLRLNATLATNNISDFQRFAPWGLSLLVP
jgi:predicted nucleic acid-binding protein